MKKAVSLVLTAFLLSSSVVPAFAQKRLTTASKKQKVAAESTRFESFAAHTDGTGVLLSWRMQAEVENIGFYIVRVGKEGDELRSGNMFVGGSALHGRELASYGDSYSYFDRDGGNDSAYYIEALSLNGSRIRTEQIYPNYVSSLESFPGRAQGDHAARLETEESNPAEKSILTYTKEIANEMSENAIEPDPVTHKAVISTPGAVRIGVRNEGLHRVSAAQLTAAGFDVASDSAMWQLYVNGVEQAIIVGNNGEYIEFYGKGVDTNEADVRRYYLINGSTPGKRMETRVATRNTSTVVTPSYLQTFTFKDHWQWVDDIINEDYDNYFGRGIGTTAFTNYNFNFTGIDFSAPTATVRVKFQGYSFTAHQIDIVLNDHPLGVAAGLPGETSFDAVFFVPTSHLIEGTNTFKFKAVGPAGDFNFFDNISVDYSRKYLATSNRLNFYTQNYRIAKLDGFTSPNVRVFDLTRESEPVLMTNLQFVQNGSTFGVDMPAARGRSFFAVEDSGIRQPVSVTANNPELLGVPTHGADMVIIYYKSLDYVSGTPVDLSGVAQTWANYRVAQGAASVKLVEVSDIYDEFSYGTLSPNAIKSFLQYAHTSWSNPPEYVLLMGDASWDSRNWENVGFYNFIPPKLVSTVFTDTASDEALADFNADGLAELAIGRIAARTPEQATVAFDKMVWWEAQVNPMSRGALFAYDLDSTGYPFSVMSQNLRNKIPGVDATMVQRGGTTGRDNLIAGINTGKYIVNYSGHGSAGSWNGDFLTTSMILNTTVGAPPVNPHDPSLYTMLTCLNGYYHWLYFPSMAELLVNTPGKGAVAAWASSGKTTPDMQEQMAIRFYEKLNEGNIVRMGDLVKEAKSALVTWGIDVRLSWALIGDPMMKTRPPAVPPAGPLAAPSKK